MLNHAYNISAPYQPPKWFRIKCDTHRVTSALATMARERGTNFPNAASLGLWSLAWLLARHRPPSCREKNKSGQIKEQVARLGKTCCQEQYTFLPICGACVRTRICEQMYFGVACFLRSIWCSDTFFFFRAFKECGHKLPCLLY